jgi:uncharacterized C2H2 Zn-finger protein
MDSSSITIKCSKCNALFLDKKDLKQHLKELPSHKTFTSKSLTSIGSIKKKNPDSFTATAVDATDRSKLVPDTVFRGHGSATSTKGYYISASSSKVSASASSTKVSASASSTKGKEDSLLAGIAAGFATKEKSKPTKTGIESSILCSIAEDEELVAEYLKLDVDGDGTKKLTGDIAKLTSKKALRGTELAVKIMKKAQQVSLCFLVDTTSSMSSYIIGVKNQIKAVALDVEKSGCVIEGLAFIGYKDHCDGIDHFESLPFTKNVEAFIKFVDNNVRASGGGDTPEDVNGGLKKAVYLPWPDNSGTRIIFHVADAPPHGTTFYSGSDDYPSGHSTDIPFKTLFQNLLQKNILYQFGKVNNSCDKMLQVFETYYDKPIDAYNIRDAKMLSGSVTSSIMTSVGATSRSMASKHKVGKKIERNYALSKDIPAWENLTKYPMLEVSVCSYELPESMEEIKSFAKFKQKVVKRKAQVATAPFAKGGVRYAFYGKIHFSEVTSVVSTESKSAEHIADDVVFKEMICPSLLPELDRQRYMSDLELQSVSAKLAFEFNSRIQRTTANPNIKIKFLMAKVVRMTLPDGTYRFMAQERLLKGVDGMVKFTNNLNFVHVFPPNDHASINLCEFAVAFSHFTYIHSDGYLMVCDLQGISIKDEKGANVLLLTDPAIHCPGALRFGKTNLQKLGIDKFFSTHKCNKYCAALGL